MDGGQGSRVTGLHSVMLAFGRVPSSSLRLVCAQLRGDCRKDACVPTIVYSGMRSIAKATNLLIPDQRIQMGELKTNQAPNGADWPWQVNNLECEA